MIKHDAQRSEAVQLTKALWIYLFAFLLVTIGFYSNTGGFFH
jgi:hypothetical protein